MNRKTAAALSVLLLLAGCEKQDSALLAPIKRASIQRTPRPIVPASQWRPELRSVYRLHPDSRFLLAFGEIDRLAGALPAPAGKSATAEFAGDHWAVRFGDGQTGLLPELPDFPDFLTLLVVHAKAVLPQGAAASAERLPGGVESFLMPALEKDIEAAERALEKDGSYRQAATCYARLAFQLPDPQELAPLIPARALALLAAERARDPRAGTEEEVLLAEALGYTAHAERLAATLPATAPLRAFESLDEHALEQMASLPKASEELRFLAVRRATRHGDLGRWRQARTRFMPGNDSVAVIATGLDIELPGQVELELRRSLLEEALPRAVVRELGLLPKDQPNGFETISAFDTRLSRAVVAAKGSLWDGSAVTAYYEAAYYAPFGPDRWPSWMAHATQKTRTRLLELGDDRRTRAPDPRGDTRGAALLIRAGHRRHQRANPLATEGFLETRALMPWLDTRPVHRLALADLGRYPLQDPRMTEDLYRSLAAVLGDGSRRGKAEAALFLGDGATLHRILGSPDLTAPEATDILWHWSTTHVDRDRLCLEFDRAIQRFPNDWNATNFYIDLLRDRKEYRKACEIVERWLAANPDRSLPGHFHAHVRLAHNYVLAHEFEKGRKLLEGMTESESFQRAIRDRALAECLAGLGRFQEAEKLAREAVSWTSGDPETVRVLISILWMAGKDDEAADLLVKAKDSLAEWQLCEALQVDFRDVFLEQSSERLAHAVEAIAKRPELSFYYVCVSRGFGNARRWEDAVRITERLAPPTPDRMDELIRLYEYVKSGKGHEAAAQWLKEKIPEDKRNPLSMKALITENDDLLWDVIVTPNPNDHPEWVWLFRAVGFALRGSAVDPHRGDLLAYYDKKNADDYHLMGRYLVGLGSEEELFALASSSHHRSEIAYYLGVRAQNERRFRDACEWYRVAAESGEETSPRALALNTLSKWSATGQGIWKIEEGPVETRGGEGTR